MLQAFKKNAIDPDLVVLGITDENEKRMKDDKPMLVNLHDISPDLPDVKIMIIRGKDEHTMAANLGIADELLHSGNGVPH